MDRHASTYRCQIEPANTCVLFFECMCHAGNVGVHTQPAVACRVAVMLLHAAWFISTIP